MFKTCVQTSEQQLLLKIVIIIGTSAPHEIRSLLTDSSELDVITCEAVQQQDVDAM